MTLASLSSEIEGVAPCYSKSAKNPLIRDDFIHVFVGNILERNFAYPHVIPKSQMLRFNGSLIILQTALGQLASRHSVMIHVDDAKQADVEQAAAKLPELRDKLIIRPELATILKSFKKIHSLDDIPPAPDVTIHVFFSLPPSTITDEVPRSQIVHIGEGVRDRKVLSLIETLTQYWEVQIDPSALATHQYRRLVYRLRRIEHLALPVSDLTLKNHTYFFPLPPITLKTSIQTLAGVEMLDPRAANMPLAPQDTIHLFIGDVSTHFSPLACKFSGSPDELKEALYALLEKQPVTLHLADLDKRSDLALALRELKSTYSWKDLRKRLTLPKATLSDLTLELRGLRFYDEDAAKNTPITTQTDVHLFICKHNSEFFLRSALTLPRGQVLRLGKAYHKDRAALKAIVNQLLPHIRRLIISKPPPRQRRNSI